MIMRNFLKDMDERPASMRTVKIVMEFFLKWKITVVIIESLLKLFVLKQACEAAAFSMQEGAVPVQQAGRRLLHRL